MSQADFLNLEGIAGNIEIESWSFENDTNRLPRGPKVFSEIKLARKRDRVSPLLASYHFSGETIPGGKIVSADRKLTVRMTGIMISRHESTSTLLDIVVLKFKSFLIENRK